MNDSVTKLAYQTLQQGKGLLGLAHKEISTKLMDLVAPDASASTVPTSLNGALKALDADHDYLLDGGVFSKDFIDNWIALKYEEVQQLRQRPHPHKFTMYYDA